MSDQNDMELLARLMDAMHAANALPAGAVIVPKDYRIASTEEFNEHSQRLRGHFATALIEDFANYYARNVKADKLSHAPVFIDTQPLNAFTPLDWMMGDDQPGHLQHVATCQPTPLPDWLALLHAHGEPMSQDGVVDWLEDITGAITAFDDTGEGMPLSQIVHAFRNTNITKKSEHAQTLEDTSVNRSALESIDANASRRAPAKITFAVMPYEGFSTYSVLVRVIIRSVNDQPVFTLRIVGLERIKHAIAQEFVNLTQSAIRDFFHDDEPPALYVGTFTWQNKRGYANA